MKAFTLDRTWKGANHAASLNRWVKKVVRDLKKVNAALKYKDRDILEIEELQRKTKIFLLSREIQNNIILLIG